MKRSEGACLICGAPLSISRRPGDGVLPLPPEIPNAQCGEAAFICDECHSKRGIEVVMEGCRKTPSKTPSRSSNPWMEDPFVYMHGPEHHVMVGGRPAGRLSQCRRELDLEQALAEMTKQGQQVTGGACGF